MSSTKKPAHHVLEELLKELDEKDLASLPPDEILNMKKKMNPYGRTIEGSDEYVNFSITQIHLEYWKKFITTALIGFLNRMNDEWKVPEGLPVVSVLDYLKDPSKLDTPQILVENKDERAIKEWEMNRMWMDKFRVPVFMFMEEFFQFNPDEHVRSAYRPNRADLSRKPIDTEAALLAIEHLKKTDKDFRAKEELYADIVAKLKNIQTQQETPTVDNQVSSNQPGKKKYRVIKDKDGKIVRKIPIETPNQTEALNSTEALDPSKKSDTGPDPTLASTVRTIIPPHDTFGRFTTYYKNNLETLRDAVNDLYCEKPDLELAINIYSHHATAAEAEAFKKKHSNEVIAEIFTAQTGKWNFFDSFKEQRENTNVYNENTIILEEMIKQLERDERLGQDLMKKRVRKAKARNELLDGKDAESFKKWRSQNTEMQKMGASHIGDMASPDCPDDAVQVDIWKVNPSTMKVTKDYIFTAAEAPTFVQDAQEKAGIVPAKQ